MVMMMMNKIFGNRKKRQEAKVTASSIIPLTADWQKRGKASFHEHEWNFWIPLSVDGFFV